MVKPICVACQCFYRPERNGHGRRSVEGMPNGTAEPTENIRGRRKPEAWQPYKLWVGDRRKCPDCGHENIEGVGGRPISEHYLPDIGITVKRYAPELQVNDC